MLIFYQNAFSKLATLGLDIFKMLVPDVLHEFELGVWKMILAHLIRLLYAHGGDEAVNKLDQRYSSRPSLCLPNLYIA
jgi:hypothetical protein